MQAESVGQNPSSKAPNAAPLKGFWLLRDPEYNTAVVIIFHPSIIQLHPTGIQVSSMSARPAILCAKLKQLGFTQQNQMRLYGEEFQFLSDPIVMPDGTVFLDALEKRSHQTRQIRVPLPIVNMSNTEPKAA